jgi:hypothetical protein
MRHPPTAPSPAGRCHTHHRVVEEPQHGPNGQSWLLPGESVHAEIHADAWRYLAIDVPYDHRTILYGGPVGWTISAIASAIGNRRTRQAAERLAAPQWRYLGHLPIIVTNQRLLVWYADQWNNVWLSAIEHVSIDGHRLELYFTVDPPYLLDTPHASAVASAATGSADAKRRHAPLLGSASR